MNGTMWQINSSILKKVLLRSTETSTAVRRYSVYLKLSITFYLPYSYIYFCYWTLKRYKSAIDLLTFAIVTLARERWSRPAWHPRDNVVSYKHWLQDDNQLIYVCNFSTCNLLIIIHCLYYSTPKHHAKPL